MRLRQPSLLNTSLTRLDAACIGHTMTWLNAGDLARLLYTGDSSLTYNMKRSNSLAIRFTSMRNSKRPTIESLLANLVMDSTPLSELTLYSPSLETGFSPRNILAFVTRHMYTLKSLTLNGHHIAPFILPYMPELKTLQVDILSGEDRVTFAQVLPSLKSLVVGDRCSKPGVNPNMTNFHNLTTMHLGYIARSSMLQGIVLPLLVNNFYITLDGDILTSSLASIVRCHPTPFSHFAMGLTNWDWISGRNADTDLLRFILAWQSLPFVELLHAPCNNRLADWLSSNQLCSLWFDADVKDESTNAVDRTSSSSHRIRRGLGNRQDTKLGVSVCHDKQWSIPHVVPASVDPFGRKLKVMRIELLTRRALQCKTLVAPEPRDAYNIDHRALVLNGFVVPQNLSRLVEPKTLVIREAFGDFRLPFHCITHLDIGTCVATETFMLPQTVISLVIRTPNESLRATNSICSKFILCSTALESLTLYYDLPPYFRKPFLTVSDQELPNLKHVSAIFSSNKPHRKYPMWPRKREDWPRHLETLLCSYEYDIHEGDSWARINLSILPASVKRVDIKTMDVTSARHVLQTTSQLPSDLVLSLRNCCNNDLRTRMHDSVTMWLLGRNRLFSPKFGLLDITIVAILLFVLFWAVLGVPFLLSTRKR